MSESFAITPEDIDAAAGRIYAQAGNELAQIADALRRSLGFSDGDIVPLSYSGGAFSAGDLMMVTVLRRLAGSGLLEAQPNICAYIARAEARPAYQRAFEAQLAVFTAASGR